MEKFNFSMSNFMFFMDMNVDVYKIFKKWGPIHRNQQKDGLKIPGLV
jgi:hypothetical protein